MAYRLTQLTARPRLLVVPLLAGLQLASGQVLANPASKTDGVPGLYATKAEAEQAAKQHFHCTGAHPMGQQWMPCASHGHGAAHPSTPH